MMSISSSFHHGRRLGLVLALAGFLFPSFAVSATRDDERIAGLQEQIRTLENVSSNSKNPGERARLDSKLDRSRRELGILQERQAIELREKSLSEDLQRSTADTLREKLRSIDRTVEEGEVRMHDLLIRRQQVTADREALIASLDASRSKAGQTADRLAEQEEQLYTLNESMRGLALQRETTETEIELARDADRLREQLKSFDPHQRASLRSIFESYGRWRDARKAEEQLRSSADDLGRNLKVTQSSLDLTQQKLAKYDEELALLEKQTGFFNSDTQVSRLIATQRSQKKALSERLPIISSQVEAVQRSEQLLKLRGELLGLGTALQAEQFRALQESYYQRLRWPVLLLAALLTAYLLSVYAGFPLWLKNEDLLLARRLARYACVVLSVGTMAGFLFDDLSMVMATLGVVSAALVISLQDVCTSVFGWFVIMMGGKFGIGDRLEVDGARGDVIDIQLLRTTLLEINGWLGVDQPTGRVIVMPNNFIFKTKVFNFTHGHPYIWGKIDVTVTYTTPVNAASELFLRVLTEETRDEFVAAEQAALAMKKRYGVDDAAYHPKIYTTLADSGITFSLFYVAHYRGCSTVRNRINRRLIAELESRPHIQLAYHTLNLLHAPNTPGMPSAFLGNESTGKPFPATATTVDAGMGIPPEETVATAVTMRSTKATRHPA